MRWKSHLNRDTWTNDRVVEGLFKSIISELNTDGLDAIEMVDLMRHLPIQI